MAETFIAVAREEAEGMLAGARRAGGLNWAIFADSWFRMVRRVVFGDGARDDTRLRALIDGLRADGNWAFLKPQRRGCDGSFIHAWSVTWLEPNPAASPS